MTSPEEFSNHGLDILTQWAQITEQMKAFAAVFEARGGTLGIQAAKYPDNGTLTQEQIDFNAAVDAYAAKALEVVTFWNALNTWYDASQQQRVNINRTDY